MNYLKDYENIEKMIDQIIGINTQQGKNLSEVIKKYFESKPLSIKLVQSDNTDYKNFSNNSFISPIMNREIHASKKAMDKYTEKLRKANQKLKDSGEYCGMDGR